MANATRKKPYPSGKGQTIDKAKDWYGKSTGVIFTDYRGLSVKKLQELRTSLRAKGGEIHVLKNTLFRQAVGSDIDNFPAELHNGPTAVAFIYENESDCAKAIVDFATASKVMQVKGGYFAGKAMNAKQVEALSKLPSRDVLIAQVIGAISAPLTTLVGTVEALYATPIRTIYAAADKLSEGSPAPAPAAKAEAAPAEEAPAEVAQAEEAPAPESPAAEEAAPEPTPEENA